MAYFCRITTADACDLTITAELPPDPETLPPGEAQEQARRLEKIVLTNMIHGPCGKDFPNSPCLVDGVCSKGFPKDFSSFTIVDPDRCKPVYRRRSPQDGGRTIKVKKGGREYTIDNRWVVPHSRLLLLRYNCHINVELATSPLAAKYLYKYVTKGSDRAMVRTDVEGREKDEVEDYLDLRSIGSSESAWHLLGFPIAKKFPAVYAMRIHLEDEQQVVFDEGTEEAAVEVPRDTELVAFFKYNEKDKLSHLKKPDGQKSYEQTQGPTMLDPESEEFRASGSGKDELLTYIDFPTQFTYDKKDKEWKPRKRTSYTIGRVHSVNPAAGDVFYLRILLHHDHCKGKTSFKDLRTVSGEEEPCDTYKEVCRRLGLLQDDREWSEALTEAAATGMCPQLRELYVTILLYCEPANPKQLFEDHWEQWVDDFQRQAERRDQHLSWSHLTSRGGSRLVRRIWLTLVSHLPPRRSWCRWSASWITTSLSSSKRSWSLTLNR